MDMNDYIISEDIYKDSLILSEDSYNNTLLIIT